METNLIVLLLGVFIYALSALSVYRWIQKAHSAGGRYSNIEPDPSDIFTMFFPVINTIIGIACLFKPASREGVERKEKRASNFFNVKK